MKESENDGKKERQIGIFGELTNFTEVLVITLIALFATI
jgi:hypothetical protein